MAIVIPKSNIYSYDFNILQDNHINKVTINETDSYNFKKVNIGKITTASRFLDLDLSNITFQNSLVNDSNSYRDVAYKNSNGSTRVSNIITSENYDSLKPTIDTYIGFYGTLQLDFTFSKDFPKKITNIIAKSPYYVYNADDTTMSSPIKSGIDEQSLTIEYMETRKVNYMDDVGNLSDGSLGKIKLFPNLTSDNKMEFVLLLLAKRLTHPELFSERRTEYEIQIEYETSDVTSTYDYSISSSANKNFQLESNSLFSIYNGDGTNKIFDLISKNIVDNYQNGRMTLEIETRYTTFKDSDGNAINNGNNYLIKAGDVVKPEMTNKFKNFEYEYVVTSAEYEYDGSDKLYLKLLQI